jgi:predicted Fe-Mo cluster-binding NifX family protein
MKIAIPTEDGFTIHQEMSPVKGFLISTIQFGEVVQQDMRWIHPDEFAASGKGYYQALEDCDKVIVREIGYEQSNYLQLHKTEVVKTEETIITKVLMHYLEEVMHKESNTYCCP